MTHGLAQHVIAAMVLAAAATSAQAISNGNTGSGFGSVGRGVQVAPDWVFTAQHYAMSVGETYSNAFGSRTVAAVYTAPNSTGFPANDLALMRLAPTSSSAPSLPVNGSIVPYGQFAPWDVTLASAVSVVPGSRTYGFSTISESLLTYVDISTQPPTPYTVNWLISNDASVYVQGGDSGSGLFAGHVTDSSVLMGIASAQITDDTPAMVPLGSAYVQPAAYRSWIDATLLADPFDSNVILWTTVNVPVPEAATWGLWALGLGLTLRVTARRRRQA